MDQVQRLQQVQIPGQAGLGDPDGPSKPGLHELTRVVRRKQLHQLGQPVQVCEPAQLTGVAVQDPREVVVEPRASSATSPLHRLGVAAGAGDLEVVGSGAARCATDEGLVIAGEDACDEVLAMALYLASAQPVQSDGLRPSGEARLRAGYVEQIC